MESNSNRGCLGYITDIQKFSTHNGPGIRTTIFLKGCPLSCDWCANPETISLKEELYFIKSRCKECLNCISECDVNAIEYNNGIAINRLKCKKCFKCTRACPNNALTIVGKKTSVEELMRAVLKDKPFYGENGGVTFSGGEPMLQTDFLLEALKSSKQNGLHVVLDTCGYAQKKYVESIVEYIDMTLLDIKHMDDEKHKDATGVSNKIILNNAKIFSSNTSTRISLVLIPGFNDDEENLKKTADFANRLNIKYVDINLLHKYGEQKYKYLDRDSPYSKYCDEFSNESISKIVSIFNEASIKTTLGRNF